MLHSSKQHRSQLSPADFLQSLDPLDVQTVQARNSNWQLWACSPFAETETARLICTAHVVRRKAC